MRCRILERVKIFRIGLGLQGGVPDHLGELQRLKDIGKDERLAGNRRQIVW